MGTFYETLAFIAGAFTGCLLAVPFLFRLWVRNEELRRELAVTAGELRTLREATSAGGGAPRSKRTMHDARPMEGT